MEWASEPAFYKVDVSINFCIIFLVNLDEGKFSTMSEICVFLSLNFTNANE